MVRPLTPFPPIKDFFLNGKKITALTDLLEVSTDHFQAALNNHYFVLGYMLFGVLFVSLCQKNIAYFLFGIILRKTTLQSKIFQWHFRACHIITWKVEKSYFAFREHYLAKSKHQFLEHKSIFLLEITVIKSLINYTFPIKDRPRNISSWTKNLLVFLANSYCLGLAN